MKKFMVIVLMVVLSTSLYANEATPGGVEERNTVVRAVSWLADALIVQPLGLVKDIISIGGNLVNARVRVFTSETRPDGSTSRACIDIDTRSKEQREADNAETNYAPVYEDNE